MHLDDCIYKIRMPTNFIIRLPRLAVLSNQRISYELWSTSLLDDAKNYILDYTVFNYIFLTNLKNLSYI